MHVTDAFAGRAESNASVGPRYVLPIACWVCVDCPSQGLADT